MVEGINEGPVTEWLETNVEPATGPFTFEMVSGGKSNLTYRVDDAAGNAFVLRRPPLGQRALRRGG